ncbi:L,D-transpeptidase [Plastoroseomonas hellenica]|uniref:L,D-transpeptidase n=1 Tax=Plastoroseomonas hellenica TaxID=2687306 RepID=UPI001FEC97CE|nr:L,D-transpeptidase [Plastoroseomonas hellenica]
MHAILSRCRLAPPRLARWLLAGALLNPAACAPAQDGVAAATPVAPAPAASAPPLLDPAEVAAEATRLRAALARAVPQGRPSPERDQAWIALAQAVLANGGTAIDRPQLIIAVDRNPAVQQLAILLARPDGAWEVIGGSRVSTGQAGRRHYYITPTGIFPHTDAILDWRAEGTFNENRIRGLGTRGMRVWDFGWVMARKGWRSDGEEGEIRLLLHATDPDALEQRLGRTASQGCVRVPSAMNRFLDLHGVLDIDHERAAADDPRFRALLRPDRTPTPLAGRLMVVFDSAAAAAPSPSS